MEYTVGSLADLISGKKTPNKVKVIKKSFTPIKKEIEEPNEERGFPDSVRTPKKEKVDVPFGTDSQKKRSSDKPSSNLTKKANSKKKIRSNLNPQKGRKRKFEQPGSKENPKKLKLSKNELNAASHIKNQNGRERTLQQLETKESPKKLQLSKNELNAASRIKNKQNKETKNSSEYKERTLFVGNLPNDIKKLKIKKYFLKYGPIESVRIRGISAADPKTSKRVAAIKKEFHPDRNTVYAYIRFVNSEDAHKAEVENGILFQDRHLRVEFCETTDKPDESKAIFVGNLSFKAEEEELWNLFKPCGLISHVRIVRDGRTGMGKGFGYVNFKDADSVQLALEMGKVVLKDRELRISVCDTNRAKKMKQKPQKAASRKPKSKQQKDGEDASNAKDKNVYKFSNNNKAFSGTKFSDIKKKTKFSKAKLEKKKLARKLTAPTAPKS